jgi:hypothetical protein
MMNFLERFFELIIILRYSFTITFGTIFYMTANIPFGGGGGGVSYCYFFKTKFVTQLISKPYCENADPEFQLKLIT